MWTFILAIVLLVGDPEKTEDIDSSWFHLAAPVARQMAIDWEIMDEREVYFLLYEHSFRSDLVTLRTRYRDLRCAPSCHDSIRFPDREQINEMLAFNRKYREHAEAMRVTQLYRADDWREVVTETDQLYHIWDLIRDAGNEQYYVSTRRQALMDIRKKLGPDAYYKGQMPPHVPIWRFQEIK
jgi:hypothetical protein